MRVNMNLKREDVIRGKQKQKEKEDKKQKGRE